MNAIIAAATGYSDTDLQPFLSSVDRSCTDTKVFLIVFKRDYARIERLRGKYPFVEPVYVGRKPTRWAIVYRGAARLIARHFITKDYPDCSPLWGSVGRYSLHIALERYFIALELVRAHRSSLQNVLLTDSRDVVLQGDPFSAITDSLVSGLEEATIGCCSVNSSWLKHVYGPAVHARMSKCRIICSGVTIGPVQEMEQYLAAMCREIWKCLPRVAASPFFDQSIHNYLIYNGTIRPTLTENRTGIIATLFYEKPGNIKTDAEAGVVTVRGKPPAIVHQYDRHANVVLFVKQRA